MRTSALIPTRAANYLETVPELPEAERARLALERAMGREIVAVDDRDTYVPTPSAR
jgi:hypothetical protein